MHVTAHHTEDQIERLQRHPTGSVDDKIRLAEGRRRASVWLDEIYALTGTACTAGTSKQAAPGGTDQRRRWGIFI